jgi:hypothetical protein
VRALEVSKHYGRFSMITNDAAYALAAVPADALLARAAAIRDEAYGSVQTYSP